MTYNLILVLGANMIPKLIGCLILAIFVSSCTTAHKAGPLHTTSANRGPLSPEQLKNLGIERSLLIDRDNFQIRREARSVSGDLTIIDGKGGASTYRGRECTFAYEKGQGVVHRNDLPYLFETISVGIMGRDQSGDDFFDRFSYTNADYTNTFVTWDFNKNFGPIDLDSTLRFGHDDIQGSLRFTKSPHDGPTLELRHTDTFATARSHYFRPGEKRDTTIRISFNRLDQERVSLNRIHIIVMSAVRDRFGNYQPAEKVTDIICSQFEEV